MPFLRDLVRKQQEVRQAGDKAGHERVKMVAAGMLTPYAVAEDIGYEW